MTLNPYQAPPPIDEAAAHHPSRAVALFHLRLAVLFLSLPALYNHHCFLLHAPQPNPFGPSGRVVSLLGMAAAGIFLGMIALPMLEAISRRLHAVLARRADIADWNDALYQTLQQAHLLAALGAVLWFIWVVGYYHLQINFYLLSFPTGILAHLLAACLYLPLFYRWYFVARGARSVGFCSAKAAVTDATFAERKATLINSQPRSERRHGLIHERGDQSR